MGIARTVLLRASKNPWLRERLPHYRFARKAVRRFMPGEDIASALQAAAAFQQENISTVLTYLGENVSEPAQAEASALQYCDALSKIANASLSCELSVKLTQLGHDIDPSISLKHLERIAQLASELGNYIWIDMEESRYVDSTLELYRRLHSVWPNTGVCLQAYLFRTAGDLQSLLNAAPGVRLVKGAYREAPQVAFPRKEDVDNNFFRLSQSLLDAAKRDTARPGFATHDPRLVRRILQEAEARQVSPQDYEFQMLYGIRTESLRQLRNSGHRCRILISYGPAWFPWYMRRLAERPANVLFVLRNIWSSAPSTGKHE